MNSNIELKISFRFAKLSEHQATILKNTFSELKLGKHFKTKNITGSIPLTEDNISLISSFMETNDIPKEITDIFISFVTEYGTRIIDVPTYVNQAVIKLGSKITLSYTII